MRYMPHRLSEKRWSPNKNGSFNQISFRKGYILPGSFPGDSVIKNLPASTGDLGLIPGLGRPTGEGNGTPLQYSCLGNPMDRTLVGCNPWGRKESDMTEQLKNNEYTTYPS